MKINTILMSDNNDVKIGKLEERLSGIERVLQDLSKRFEKTDEKTDSHFEVLSERLREINNTIPNRVQVIEQRQNNYEEDLKDIRGEVNQNDRSIQKELNKLRDKDLRPLQEMQQQQREWMIRAGTVISIITFISPMIWDYLSSLLNI